MNYCYKCGSKIEDSNILFCPICGQDLNKPIQSSLTPEQNRLIKKLEDLSYTDMEIINIISLSEYYKEFWVKEQRRIMQTLEVYRYDVELLGYIIAYGDQNNLTWREVSKLIANSYSPEDLDAEREEELKILHELDKNLDNEVNELKELNEAMEMVEDSINYLNSSVNSNLRSISSGLSSLNANTDLIRSTTSADFFFTHMWNRWKL